MCCEQWSVIGAPKALQIREQYVVSPVCYAEMSAEKHAM